MSAETTSRARYRSLQLLGEGGMGSVYSAFDTEQLRTVALKRLHLPSEPLKHARLIEFFHQEYRTLTQLEHPHIVRVLDYGVDEQGPFYAMELLSGDDLQRLAPLPYRQACAILRDLCSAVALLHSRRLLHRDLSPRNVRCTDEGCTKLIDFGAMASMGTVTTLIGAPPVIPPEAVLQQSLDARADLYGIGATLYFALTGTHAFPARDIGELRRSWARPVRSPSQHRSDIPRELDALVHSLLHPDPMARPRSAAEVLDRLTAIAQLPVERHLAVQSAYLATPELVGREAQLAALREVMRRLPAARGGALLIRGAAGSGRSRLLNAAVLEAKLAGATVVRASAADGGESLYGALSALVRSAGFAAEAARADLALLRRLAAGELDIEADKAERPALHAQLEAAVRTAAAERPLVLALDDLDACDLASQAALAALAEACRNCSALLCATLTNGAEQNNGALAVLATGARVVELGPLSPDETTSLLGSVFGDVPNLTAIAMRVHDSAEGNPRVAMELAQYLVDRGVVRYHAGSFSLPNALDAGALRVSLSDVRREKLTQLHPDARELAEALVAADGSGLDISAYPELTQHRDLNRVRAALNELRLSQIVHGDGTHYTFVASVWLNELRAAAPERERALYSRVADALQERDCDRLEIARYRMRAGELGGALDMLAAELAQGSRWDRPPRDYAALLTAAISACAELDRPRVEEYRLRRELVKVGSDLHVPHMLEHMRWLFAQLALDSGLCDVSPGDAALSAAERLKLASDAVQLRYAQTPLHERGLPQLAAIQALVWLSAETFALAAQIGDVHICSLVPALGLFHCLSPQIQRIDESVRAASRDIIAGRYERARERYTLSLEIALAGDPAGDATVRWSQSALRYALGCIEGGLGQDRALQYAEELEKVPGWLVPSHAVRRIYYGTVGNLREYERLRKQIELSLLQSPIKPPLAAGASHQQIYIASLCEDVIGLRNAIAELEQLATLHTALSHFVVFARAEHARVCGNHDEALSLFDGLLARLEPGSHPIWPWAAGARIAALYARGDHERALATALQDLALAEGADLVALKEHIGMPLALVEATLGHTARAYARMTDIVTRRERAGIQGASTGNAYEVRARVALMMGDKAAFTENAVSCARCYKKSVGNPALIAKYERLVREAQRRQLEVDEQVWRAVAPGVTVTESDPRTQPGLEADGVRGALRACATPGQRAERALELLLEQSGATQGQLFLFTDGRLELSASVSDDASCARFAALAASIEQHGDEVEERTQDLSDQATAGVGAAQTPHFVPLPLRAGADRAVQLVGVAVLRFEPKAPVRIPVNTANALSVELRGLTS